MMKIRIETLGCRLNQYEIESVATRLRDRGHDIVTGPDADAVIVNSCAVTATSERKTRQLMHQALRDLSRDTGVVLVTGCAAGSLSREGKVLFIPNDYKHRIPEIVEDPGLIDALSPADASRFSFAAPVRARTTRVNLKIQDGCDNRCAYCILPIVRGEPRSKPAARVLEEFRELLDAGYKEIVLSGVMIGNYEDEGYTLARLVRELLATPGTFRLHLSSLSPRGATGELLDLMAHEKMVKHLSLSLQSGSDRVLGLMNRGYTREQYLSLVARVRASVPLFNFTTDVIVGFPGETGEDFTGTLNTVRDAAFSHVHTFRYSPRPGTAAAAMADSVADEEKKERSARVIAQAAAQKEAYYRLFDGRESILLTERSQQGKTKGFNEYYVPLEGAEELKRNEFYLVRTRYRQTPPGLLADPTDRQPLGRGTLPPQAGRDVGDPTTRR